MDRSWHTSTKYVKFINNRFFQFLNELPDHIYELEMSKVRIEHKEPIVFGVLTSSTLSLQCYNSKTTFPSLSATKINTNSLQWILIVYALKVAKMMLSSTKELPDFLRMNVEAPKWLLFVQKLTAVRINKVKLSSKGLNKINIEESLNKYKKVLFDEEQVYQQLVASGSLTARKCAPMN